MKRLLIAPNRARRFLAASVLVLIAGFTRGESRDRSGDWTLSGSVAAEARGYPEDPRFEGQLDGVQPSAMFAPEIRWRSSDRSHQFKVTPFARLDGRDSERTHFDLREAYYRHVGSRWDLLVGAQQVFWGVTESRHLVDVINQRDAVEDIDEEDKLGQPMINLGLQRDWGRLDLYTLVGARERTFSGRVGRLRPPLPIDSDAARFESEEGHDRIDWAVRWSHVLGDWDLGAHLFHGTGREPRLLPDPAGGRLVPIYVVTNQAGVDLQYTREAWIWKLETIFREGQGKRFGAGVAGFEYTVFQIGESAADLGLLVEYLRDGRDGSAFPTIFDDDVFVGARLALNDVQDSEILLGAVMDREDRSVAAFLEAERRLGDHVTVGFEGRFFLNVEPAGDLDFVRDDGFAALRLSWNL